MKERLIQRGVNALKPQQRFPRAVRAIASISAIAAALIAAQTSLSSNSSDPPALPSAAVPQDGTDSHFWVVAGGGAPHYNEIALEKNVRYFQRTLELFGTDPATADIFFANGNSTEATVRYLDPRGRERFKVPDIPDLTGAATAANVNQQLRAYPHTEQADCPVFFYFTGHGALNQRNPDNNALILWQEKLLSVRSLAQQLDQWPTDIPFVTMMAQCYAGAFANLIYEGGDPTNPVAQQTRCGFFATVKTRPSVGCTPSVNESDYRDYSSSFFAGLSGRDRVGQPVATADYDQNGEVSFAEAHAFAKVDEETADWPISTAEAWLQRQASDDDIEAILARPIQHWQRLARPEQRHVIASLTAKLDYDSTRSLTANLAAAARSLPPNSVPRAYRQRLQMELINVAMTQKIRTSGDGAAIATLEKLLTCEASTW